MGRHLVSCSKTNFSQNISSAICKMVNKFVFLCIERKSLSMKQLPFCLYDCVFHVNDVLSPKCCLSKTNGKFIVQFTLLVHIISGIWLLIMLTIFYFLLSQNIDRRLLRNWNLISYYSFDAIWLYVFDLKAIFKSKHFFFIEAIVSREKRFKTWGAHFCYYNYYFYYTNILSYGNHFIYLFI